MPRKFLKKKGVQEKDGDNPKEKVVVEEEFSSAEIEEVKSKKKMLPRLRISRNSFLYVGVTMILLAAVGAAGLFYFKYQEAMGLSGNVAGASESQAVEKLVDSVGKHALLPEGEVPTIATVSNIEELSGQVFFEKAQNGDKVLIYQGSQVAFLYRPSEDRIVNIGPVTPQDTEAEKITTDTDLNEDSKPDEPTVPARVQLLNGTSITGLTRVAETDLGESDIEGYEITDRDNAANDYEDVEVVYLSDEYSGVAGEIAGVLAATVSDELPDGESLPSNIDIVVYLGTSFSE